MLHITDFSCVVGSLLLSCNFCSLQFHGGLELEKKFCCQKKIKFALKLQNTFFAAIAKFALSTRKIHGVAEKIVLAQLVSV